MKKAIFYAAVCLAVLTSCKNNEDVSNQANDMKTTDVLMTIESGQSKSGELRGMVDVDRPGSVLDWISTIEVEAEHVGTIGASYSVSETFNMVDDGSGLDNFVLNDVALGENDFSAYAESSNQVGATEYAWISGEANDPWSWIDDQRERVPNANFLGEQNGVTIYENPSAGQNVVNFDMEAESGRLIAAIRLSEEIRNGMYGSNYVVVKYRLDGGSWSRPQYFNPDHADDLLTFYFSDNDKSVDGVCVDFKFDICDVNPGATNSFTETICIQNGKSIGCIYEIGYDAVITDIDDINFTFDWQEVDCLDCPDSDYITTPAVPLTLWGDVIPMLECDYSEGHWVDATDFYWGSVTDGNYATSVMTDSAQGLYASVLQLKNGSNAVTKFIVEGNAGAYYEVEVPANSWYLLNVDDNQVWSVSNAEGFDKNSFGNTNAGSNVCQ